ncbi:MAG: LysM peptidoglycan-binding domain-containing protein [Steroidobacteraceae bacterium]|nr:LysM peptidoglycan-binding domain-containing protein [Steroidobacteraceae bacterium]
MQPQTIRQISTGHRRAKALLLAVAMVASCWTGAYAVVLAPNAPQSYVVKRGDTLWGIAKVFLRDPWHWPEIWQVNPQIHNPHLIYPGDTLRLVYVAGHPELVLQRASGMAAVQRGGGVRLEPQVRSEPLAAAITTIPYETVRAFMSRPSVLSREQIEHAPYILASLNDHAAIAEGNTIYARGFHGAQKPGAGYSVIHVGAPLRDPGNGKLLGYNGIYTGSARLTRGGDPTTLMMTQSVRESEPGDKLIPSHARVPLDFVPTAPQGRVNGRIIAVNDGVTMIGQYEVVVIDRGSRAGLAPGDVLAVYKAGDIVHDNVKNGYLRGISTFFAPKVRLPDERSGTFMVFKTYRQISYGLIMEAQNIIRVGDRVENP